MAKGKLGNDAVTMKDVEESIVIQLYKELNKLFGQGDQAFCMEYPPRNLNARDYAYTIEDDTGVLFKPQTVAEAEFNLADNAIQLASIVQGSTGERISNLYKAILNNYIPRLHFATRFAEQKGKLKTWLLEPIKGQVLDYEESSDNFIFNDFSGTRMEYSARLYRTYLYKRQAYNELLNKKKSEARDSENKRTAGEDFATWLSNVAATKEEILTTFYNDAVVRGNLHEVNSAISFLDIPTLGERLNEIKRDIRANVKRSVIGGGDVYTVNFSPSNWFESLTLAPSPIDVVTNASYRESQIQAKSNELNNARQQLSSLQNISVNKTKREQIKQEIQDTNNEIDAAYVEVRSKFQERLVTAVKFAQEAVMKTTEFAMAVYTGGAMVAVTAEINKSAQKKVRTTNPEEISHIAEIVDQTTGALKSFVKLDRARQKNVELNSKLALAKSSDYEAQIKMLQHQINKLTEQLKALESEDALYPSSLEQLKSDVLYAAQQRSTGDQGVDDLINKDIEALKALEAQTDNHGPSQNNGQSFINDAKAKLTDTYDSQATEEKFLVETTLDGLFQVDNLKQNWNETIKNDLGTYVKTYSDKKSIDEEIKAAVDVLKNLIDGLPTNGNTKQDVKKELKEAKAPYHNKLDFTTVSDIKQLQELLNKVGEDGNDTAKVNSAKDIKKQVTAHIEAITKAQTTARNREHQITSKITSLAKRLGVGKPAEEKDDYYQTIVIEVDCSQNTSRSKMRSSAISGGKSYDYWFSAGSSSYSASASNTNAESVDQSLKVTLKLRATKVTIERGGWFGVDILRLTKGLFCLDPNLRAASGNELSEFRDSGRVNSTGKFSHYPMSFLIVKDVEIIKSSSSSFSSNNQSHAELSSSSRRDSWFSSSHNESSQQSHHVESDGSNKKYFETISLPNPAIIGWFQQTVPKDESIEYAQNLEQKEEFDKTIDEFLKSIVFK